MDMLIITLIIIVICALHYYVKRKLNYFKDRDVPYAPWSSFFRGLVDILSQKKHITELILESYRQYPEAKYFGAFNLTMEPSIFIRDRELVKAVTIKHFDSFVNRGVVHAAKSDPLLGGNLVSMVDDHWREARSMLSPAFTSSKIKGMYPLMVEIANNFIKYVSELPQSDGTVVVDIKDLFTKYTNDVIAICVFGLTVDSLRNPDNEFYIYGRKISSFENQTLGMRLKLYVSVLCPKLIELFKIKILDEKVTKFFKDTVANVVKTRDEQGISRPDMIQLMMDARSDTRRKYLKLDIDEMTAQAFIFFFAGFDTTSTQLCLLSHQLAINPDVQKRLQDEIDEVMKEAEGTPTHDAIQGMQYLDAAFKESLRREAQSIEFKRVCNKPFELPPAQPGAKPFVIPNGMKIEFSGLCTHWNPEYYENPEKFDPDRYYQKKASSNDEMNLGFGVGPRMCLGNRFAILETKVLLFFLLSKFSLMPSATTCSPLKYDKTKINLVPEGGFNLVIRPRN